MQKMKIQLKLTLKLMKKEQHRKLQKKDQELSKIPKNMKNRKRP